jgi:hypothetical protein
MHVHVPQTGDEVLATHRLRARLSERESQLDNAVADETTSICRRGQATVPSMTVTPRKTTGLSSAATDVMRAVSNDISSHMGLLSITHSPRAQLLRRAS